MTAYRPCRCRNEPTCSESDPSTPRPQQTVVPETIPDAVTDETVSQALTSSAGYASSTYLGCGNAPPRPPAPRRLAAPLTTRLQMLDDGVLPSPGRRLPRLVINLPISRPITAENPDRVSGCALLRLQQGPVVLPNTGMACRLSLPLRS